MAAENSNGTGLAARLAQMLGVVRDANGQRLVKPFVRRYDRYTSLQFSRKQTQSRMLTAEPDVLLIDYTRTMMAALLLRPDPERIGMVGLGGGSQAKFCHRHLPRARIEVVENNPAVIALRRRFAIPDDDERLQVHLGDGAQFLQSRRGSYDLLLVDGYDEHGIPAALSTQQFYDDCRDALAPGGVMSVNLFSAGSTAHLELIGRSFGGRMVVLEETKMSNRVAFAWTQDALPGGSVDAGAVLDGLPEEARRQLGPAFARLAQALEEAGAR
ncbi:fused MFS/spermidine synthase [Luteimonas dalianensis]|uniref:fused MFS/spermidine synthase n=1 Tax=Luteimonas dalianensis TaxID=1148196 RepID=UPI003BF3CFAB